MFELSISFVDLLYIGNQFTCLLLLLVADQAFRKKFMHTVEFDNISKLLLLFSHFVAKSHAFNHIIRKHSIRNLR